MSTGRRLAKRSIIGTKVCAPGPDGLWYSGVIQDVRAPPPTATVTSANAISDDNAQQTETMQQPSAETKFIVRFDFKTQESCYNTSPTKSSVIMEARRNASIDISPAQTLRRNAMIKEFRESDLIGPGFRSIMGVHLQPGQRIYITFNGREQSGDVVSHDLINDEVVVKIITIGNEEPVELKKHLEEVRLLESRRSARLADQERDTDFARLADMGGDRRRTATAATATHNIEVPLSMGLHHHTSTSQQNSRKRPPSYAHECSSEQCDEQGMDECNAAMILVKLSHSPKSPKNGEKWLGSSPGSSSASWSSGSSSPPLSDDGHNIGVHITNDASASARIRTTSVSTSDEGIVVDFKEDTPRKKRANKTKFVCTWKGCNVSEYTPAKIERHIRSTHLGIKKPRRSTDHGDNSVDSDSHEEEFYYTEVEDDEDDCKSPSPSQPTLSHRDMARPPHEDPEYQRQLVGSLKQSRVIANRRQQHNNNGSNNHNQQPLVISSMQQQLQSNNTSCIPTSPLAHHNYTWSEGSSTTVVATINPKNTSNNAAYSSYQPQPTTLIRHARASPRPSQSTVPYPLSTTYVHQHHNYSSPAPCSPNSSSSRNSMNSNTTHILHHNNENDNNSANSVLHQLSQQNVTVTTHHSNSHHHQAYNHQQQQNHLASVTITPNYPNAQCVNGGLQEITSTQKQHSHLQQSIQKITANNLNTSVTPSAIIPSALSSPSHIHNQHAAAAIQHTTKNVPNSPNRRTRGENKKCRKVYGMDRRDMWCTQCRWKKACSRFGD